MKYLLLVDENGNKVKHGKEPYTLVDCPVCNRNGTQVYLERLSGMSPEMLGWEFANTERTDANYAAFDCLEQIAAEPRWFVTLQGPFGVGKTRLLACLVNAGRRHCWTSVYLTVAELFDHLRSAYNPQNTASLTFDAMWDRVLNARVLALDECDRFRPTDWAQEKYFELIEYRYRNGDTMLTAFATNANIDALDGYLVSRMRDQRGRAFQIAGGDWRMG